MTELTNEMTPEIRKLLGRASSAIYELYHNGDHAKDCEACRVFNDIEAILGRSEYRDNEK